MNSVSRKILLDRNGDIWNEVQLCWYCGKKIVRLRLPDWTERNPKEIECYERTWDGNPWFVGRAHMPHHCPGKDRPCPVGRETDPFFTLD